MTHRIGCACGRTQGRDHECSGLFPELVIKLGQSVLLRIRYSPIHANGSAWAAGHVRENHGAAVFLTNIVCLGFVSAAERTSTQYPK
jgi:hypothetical protein